MVDTDVIGLTKCAYCEFEYDETTDRHVPRTLQKVCTHFNGRYTLELTNLETGEIYNAYYISRKEASFFQKADPSWPISTIRSPYKFIYADKPNIRIYNSNAHSVIPYDPKKYKLEWVRVIQVIDK